MLEYSSLIEKIINDIPDMSLTGIETKILCMRLNNASLEDCGKEFGMTCERIRQIEAKALRKIEKYKEANA
jgi:DNA-directed RNA polymerase sigma subunit (sigma70/sigma32)